MSDGEPKACAVSVEVNGRQRFIFESDKLREMLGASRLLDRTRQEARESLAAEDGVCLFAPVSGEIRAWAPMANREALLNGLWRFHAWLDRHGIDHSIAYLECRQAHFTADSANHGCRPESWAPRVDSEPTEWNDLAWVHAALGARMARLKSAPPGVDARPSCSLFAPCRIHGHDAANHCTPNRDPDGEKRRELNSYRARAKLEAWEREKRDEKNRRGFYWDNLIEPVQRRLEKAGLTDLAQRAVSFTDLAIREASEQESPSGDQFIAFLCADGDGTGQLLTALDWNDPRWADGMPPWERNAMFVEALDRCVQTAFSHAAAEAVIPTLPDGSPDRSALEALERDGRLPLLPQLRGGEDIWMVCERSAAFTLATEFSDEFSRACSADSVIARALSIVRHGNDGVRAQTDAEPSLPGPPDGADSPESNASDGVLTMSVGIAFAKSGYPAHAMVEAAESLLSQAKALRKGRLFGRDGRPRQGCLDWHWIESSLAQTVREARDASLAYADGRRTLLLTTRPWTLEEARAFDRAARCFDAIPRRKQEQLERILRLGFEPGMLAWERWWAGLREWQQCLREVNELLPETHRMPSPSGLRMPIMPWRTVGGSVLETPLIDLLALGHVQKNLQGPTPLAAAASTDGKPDEAA